MASKHTANNETQVKSRILSNAEKEITSSTTDAWSNVMFTCNKQTDKQNMTVRLQHTMRLSKLHPQGGVHDYHHLRCDTV
jgi:hypothetical protein